MFKDIAEIVLKREPLLLLGLGAIFFAAGATGGWSKFDISIQHAGWQIALGIVGACLLGVSLLLIVRNPTAAVSVNVKDFKITRPDTKQPEQVKPPFELHGECKEIPKGIELWVFHVSGSGSGARYWPDVHATVDRDRWHCRINRLSGNLGELRRLSVFAIGKNGQALVHYFKYAGTENSKDGVNRWPGITELTNDMAECGSVEVIIGQQSA